MKWFWIAIFFSFSLIAAPSAAQDLSPDQERTYKRVLFEVLSPFCPGRSLNDCPSGAAGELKDEIRGLVVSGQTEQQIVEMLLARYGQEILAVPPMAGAGIPLWIGPVVFFSIGGILLLFWLRLKSAKGGAE